jgi:hypothetical protein
MGQVGLVLEQKLKIKGRNLLCVVKLVDGGPAHSSRRIQIGDVLTSVDGAGTVGKPLEEVVPLIVGQEGTTVKLTFMRGDQNKVVTVFLIRGTPKHALPRPCSSALRSRDSASETTLEKYEPRPPRASSFSPPAGQTHPYFYSGLYS